MRPAALVLFLLLLLSCRKENFTTRPDARLRPAIDTLQFDTVFTTAGSVTQSFLIRNPNREGIRISAIRLGGGAASPFRLNADGQPGPLVRDLEVAGGDSLYVFVNVRVEPSAADLPFVVRDSVVIEYNGQESKVQLQAWGRNARFLRGHTVRGQEAWDNRLPYVIVGALTVAEGARLTITQGTQVYLHADAPLIVRGQLVVTGGPEDSNRVVFTGDRLDAPYRDFPASWPGLVFTETSRNSLLQYAAIRNAYQGIVIAGKDNQAPSLELAEVLIDNAFDAGLLAVRSTIRARNLLVSNCGKGVQLAGGDHLFEHATLAGYSNGRVTHKEAVLQVANELQGRPLPLRALFRNCIFWGEDNGIVAEEVVTARNSGAPFDLRFEGVLWRVNADPAGSVVSGANLKNTDPAFDSTGQRAPSFRLKETSPALDAGLPSGITLDLDGRPRPVRQPDLGAYERQ